MDHTDVCRQRILEAFMSTEKGRERMEAYEEKTNWALADRQEAEEEEKAKDTEQDEASAPSAGKDEIDLNQHCHITTSANTISTNKDRAQIVLGNLEHNTSSTETVKVVDALCNLFSLTFSNRK